MEDYEKWHETRSKVQQDLMRPKSAQYYIRDFQEVSQDFVNYVRAVRSPSDQCITNFLPEIYRFTFEAVALVALDTRLGCMKADLDPELKKFFETMQLFLGSFPKVMTSIPTWKIMPPRWNKMFRETEDYLQILLDYGQARVQESIERMKNRTEDDGQHEMSVLEKMIVRNGTESTIPIVMALDMLFAGIDTTGNTLAYLLYNLAQNPDKQAKLRQECIHMGETLTPQTIEKMKYYKACSKESLRLTPTVANMARFNAEDTVIQGYRIPKDTFIIWSEHLFAQDESHFPNWEKYEPERWLGRNHGICPYSSMQFGRGPRMCIGKRFAEIEMQILIHKLMRNFEVKWTAKEPMTLSQVLFNNPDQPMEFQFKDL